MYIDHIRILSYNCAIIIAMEIKINTIYLSFYISIEFGLDWYSNISENKNFVNYVDLLNNVLIPI